MNQEKTSTNPDDYTRIVTLIKGKAVEGNFWCYVAVKPSRYDDVEKAYNEGRLDISKFVENGYGEIIVSGLGDDPPNQVTAKVQVMYMDNPNRPFDPKDPKKQLDAAMRELANSKKADKT